MFGTRGFTLGWVRPSSYYWDSFFNVVLIELSCSLYLTYDLMIKESSIYDVSLIFQHFDPLPLLTWYRSYSLKITPIFHFSYPSPRFRVTSFMNGPQGQILHWNAGALLWDHAISTCYQFGKMHYFFPKFMFHAQ